VNNTYRVVVTDEEIIQAYNRVRMKIKHTDSPGERDGCEIREALDAVNSEMISLFWLRNRVVALRKKDLLLTQSE